MTMKRSGGLTEAVIHQFMRHLVDALPHALFHIARQCYISAMTTTENIKKAVEQLAPRELARFRAWFETFDARRFDAAVERDASAGRLDALAEEALAAHRAGRSREL
jgi:hypothetical protein